MSPFWPLKYAKITQFWTFLPKMTFFDQIDHIYDIFFYQISVHKPEWNNC